jgi:hypothetical protein
MREVCKIHEVFLINQAAFHHVTAAVEAVPRSCPRDLHQLDWRSESYLLGLLLRLHT